MKKFLSPSSLFLQKMRISRRNKWPKVQWNDEEKRLIKKIKEEGYQWKLYKFWEKVGR